MKLNTKLSMKMKLKLKSKFKKSKAKPSPCSSGRSLRKRDVFAKVLRFFRKFKGCVIPREGVPEPEEATKKAPMVEHLIELDLPFAKLDDETFLEYLNGLLVNKSSELHSGIQDEESCEILRLSSNFLNQTPETFVESLEDTMSISVKLLELLEVSLDQTPVESIETKEFLQISTQKGEMTPLEILALVGATLALNPELEPAEILEFYNILEQEPELVAVQTIKPLDVSLDQTPLEAEETLESSGVSPLEKEPQLAVETIEPINVSLDQTHLESEETIEWYDISLAQTPLPEKPLEFFVADFRCSTDKVEEERHYSKMSERNEKDELVNETLNNEGRSLGSMTFNSLMTITSLESSEAMKINYAQESGSSQNSSRPYGLDNSSIGLQNDDTLTKDTLSGGQSLCSPKLEACCGNPTCNGLTKDMFSGFQGFISLKLEDCCEGKVACKKPSSLTFNIPSSSSTPKEEVTNTNGTKRTGTKKRGNRRRGKGKSNKTVGNDGKQKDPTGAKVTSKSPGIKNCELEIQTKITDTKMEVPDVEVPEVEVIKVEAPKGEDPEVEGEANTSEAPKITILGLETSHKPVDIEITSLNTQKVYPEQLKKLFDEQATENMAIDPSKKWVTPKNRKRNLKNKNNKSSSRGSSFNPQLTRIVEEERGYTKEENPRKIIPKDKVAISDSKKQAALLPDFTPFEHPEDKEFFDFSTLLTDKEFLAKTNFNWADDPSIEDIL